MIVALLSNEYVKHGEPANAGCALLGANREKLSAFMSIEFCWK